MRLPLMGMNIALVVFLDNRFSLSKWIGIQRSTDFILFRQAMAILRVSAMKRTYWICTSRRLLCQSVWTWCRHRWKIPWGSVLWVGCPGQLSWCFPCGAKQKRRKEGEERNRCEEALYLLLITSSFDIHYSQGRIMDKRKEKSSSEFTSLTSRWLEDETTRHMATEGADHVLLRRTCAAASATIGSDGVL